MSCAPQQYGYYTSSSGSSSHSGAEVSLTQIYHWGPSCLLLKGTGSACQSLAQLPNPTSYALQFFQDELGREKLRIQQEMQV